MRAWYYLNPYFPGFIFLIARLKERYRPSTKLSQSLFSWIHLSYRPKKQSSNFLPYLVYYISPYTNSSISLSLHLPPLYFFNIHLSQLNPHWNRNRLCISYNIIHRRNFADAPSIVHLHFLILKDRPSLYKN